MARDASPAPTRTSSVPLAACEPAERDQTDQQDDQAEPEAPHDHQHDPDDHEDAAKADTADAALSIRHLPPPCVWSWLPGCGPHDALNPSAGLGARTTRPVSAGPPGRRPARPRARRAGR